MFYILMASVKHWFLRMFTVANRVAKNTWMSVISVSVLFSFVVENCLKILFLIHLHLGFDGKTPNGFRQTKGFEDVDVLLNLSNC